MGTREKLLETALQVFAERGSDGGSMREIARRAGVNVATAYHHFGSKRDMLLAIFRDLGFLDGPAVDLASVGNPATSAQALEWIILGSWVFMSTGTNILRLAITEAIKGDEDVIAVFDEWQQQGDSRLEFELLRGGLASPDNAAQRAVLVRLVIWGAFVGGLMQVVPPAFDEWQQRARSTAERLLETWA